MADIFRGTVESLVRIEHDPGTILDFKLRAGSSAQRVRSPLAGADWLREGDMVQVDGVRDNEGILVADRVVKIESPIPSEPSQPSLSGPFLIGASALINFIFWIVWPAVNIANAAGALGQVAFVALLLGGAVAAIPVIWKGRLKARLLMLGIGLTVAAVGVAKLVSPEGSLVPGFQILLFGFFAVCVYVIVRWFRRKAPHAPSTSGAG